VRRASLLIAVVVLAAGCGGGKSAETNAPATTVVPPVTTAKPPADPGRVAADAFVVAARSGNPAALWRLLSTEAQQRVGPTLERFRGGEARKLVSTVGRLGPYRLVVSERVTPEFGVVAIDGSRRGVYALALRLEGSRWRVELGGPVKVRPIGPDPNAHERIVAQVAAAVTGPGGAGTAVMYLDGQTENPKVYGTASNSTLVADFDPALDPGRHTVVVFASDGREASAVAWTFTAAKK
jgi:hypothetical protein